MKKNLSDLAALNLCKASVNLVPLERQLLDDSLNGSCGRYRNPNPGLSLTAASHDLAAIKEWLNAVGGRSAETLRSYKKEAERLLAWAIVEKSKPVSSLDVQDMLEFEKFLKSPVSIHPGLDWIAKKYVNPKTAVVSVKRYRRDNPDWRPFDGPLTGASVEHTIKVLKSMFSYWTDVGYTVVNPLKVRKRVHAIDSRAVLDRVLSLETWYFLYDFLKNGEDRITAEVPLKQRLSLIRLANQRRMIFVSLYLLGVRISELASIRMKDFCRRQTAKAGEHYWLKIIGKGMKVRTIPVPPDFIKALVDYRETINLFPVFNRGKKADANDKLAVWPSSKDSSALILSRAGTKGLTANALHTIIKETLDDAVNFLTVEMESGRANNTVNVDQLAGASAHWMRHTSATHQSLEGISLRSVKEYLGHASFDTTLIYDHLIDDKWAQEIKGFTVDNNH